MGEKKLYFNDRLLLERQKLREKSIGIRQIERYCSPENQLGVDPATVRRLLEEAVLNILACQETGGFGDSGPAQDIGLLREHLRGHGLHQVQEALKNLLTARRGKPNNLKRFWDLLDLTADENSKEFLEFSEIIFYGTLHELILSVLADDGSTDANDDPPPSPSNTSGEGSENRKWLPERRLYQRVWQSFLVHLVTWLSHGEVKIYKWQLQRAADKCGDTVINESVEDLLERAYKRALDSPKPPRRGRKYSPPG